MTKRVKRHINLFPDQTTGTVNIVHGGASTSQNTGFFNQGFTNTGSSSRKRRRRRLRARAQQQAAQAQAAAEARARAQAEAHADFEHQERLRAQAAEQAHIKAQTHARVQREQAYQQTINTLIDAHHWIQSDLAQRYTDASTLLASTVQAEIESDGEPLTQPTTGQQLAELILQEKARINYLLTQKNTELQNRNLKITPPVQELSTSTPEQYRHYLESRSQGDTERAHHEHNAWVDAASNVHEAKLLAESVAFLEQRSTALSERHALLSLADKEVQQPQTAKPLHPHSAERLWSAISVPNAPSTAPAPPEGLGKAEQIAKKIFIKAATDVLKRHPGLALALYSPTLGNSELPARVIATPASELNLPSQVDIGYVAGINGSIDVTHRLVMDDTGDRGAVKWIAADGVNVDTKVRVRNVAHNLQNNTYEFIRDGETTPALIWTPIEKPADGSTRFPGQKPALSADPGADISPQGARIDVLPGFFNDDPDDYILVFPPGSGLPDTYLLFKDPRDIPGVATGYGKPVTGVWLGETTRKYGAPVPTHIADQLRGKQFSSFRKFRETLWAAIAKDPILREQFTEQNKREIDHERAPYTRREDRAGGNNKFEIHHLHEVAEGGAVYDIDNMVIMTPKRHIEHHQRTTHEK